MNITIVYVDNVYNVCTCLSLRSGAAEDHRRAARPAGGAAWGWGSSGRTPPCPRCSPPATQPWLFK